MSRRNVRCEMQHTPQSPNKNRIRRDWLSKIDPTKDIITISHGALEAMMMLSWKGWIQVCDIDKAVIEGTEYLRKTEYKHELKMYRPRHLTIEEMVNVWCASNKYTLTDLGAVDIDLSCCIDYAMPILKYVLKTLKDYKVHTKVFLTFRNGRDQFFSTDQRINWLKVMLDHYELKPKFVSHTAYSSTSINADISRNKGSAMCIVELQT
jgi:hypothetical protein